MYKKTLSTIFLLAAAIVLMGQSSSCTAPMDATGNYTGTWTLFIKDNGTVIDELDCPLSMVLEQDITRDPPENVSVNGTVHVEYTCLEDGPNWPAWAEIPEPSNVKVAGTMDENGKLVLLSGGCGPGTCVILVLDGQGETGPIDDEDDNNEDNTTAQVYSPGSIETAQAGEIAPMTKYSGNWAFAIGVAFLGNAGDNGTFEVLRDE